MRQDRLQQEVRVDVADRVVLQRALLTVGVSLAGSEEEADRDGELLRVDEIVQYQWDVVAVLAGIATAVEAHLEWRARADVSAGHRHDATVAVGGDAQLGSAQRTIRLAACPSSYCAGT